MLFLLIFTLDIHDTLTIMLLFLFTKLLMKIWFICVVTSLHWDVSIRFFGFLWCDEQAKPLIVMNYSNSTALSSESTVGCPPISCGCSELRLEALFAHYKKLRNVINPLFNPLRYSQSLRSQLRVVDSFTVPTMLIGLKLQIVKL